MFITREFKFSAAHFLPNYNGKCKNMHGHTYKLVVTLKGNVNLFSGMIEDFSYIEKVVKDSVLIHLDHTCLNDIISNPTAEKTIEFIWNQLAPKFYGLLYQISLYESENSYVTYTGE